MCRLMPVFPLVASTSVAPASSRPDFSAASIMDNAGRSLTLPAGFMNSALPQTLAPPGGSIRDSRTTGVRPTSSSTLVATGADGCGAAAGVLGVLGALLAARRDDELSVRFRPSVIESG